MCGLANAILPFEIMDILTSIKIGKNDVFYDLGSGHGRFVRIFVKNTNAKSVNGIEIDADRFCKSVRIAKRSLTKEQRKRIGFICSDFEKFDFGDATIIYEGHEESMDEIPLYQRILKKNQVKIIKVHLPLLGYKPVKVIKNKKRCFYIMQYPLEKYKVRSKNVWASHVDDKFTTIEDVWKYYTRVLKDIGEDETSINESIQNMDILSKKRFMD